MAKSKKRALTRLNTVALQNWDTAQETLTFFFRNTAKAIQTNTTKLESLVASLPSSQQKEFELLLGMNQDLAILANKFTPEQIVSSLAFLDKRRSLEYIFSKQDIQEMEAAHA